MLECLGISLWARVLSSQPSLQCVDRRDQRVEERLLAEGGASAMDDPGDRRAQDLDHVFAIQLGLVPGRNRAAQECGAPDRTTGTAHLAGEHEADLLEHCTGARSVEGVVVADHHFEATPQRVPEVTVADDGVELGEVHGVLDDGRGHRPQHQIETVE
jgi:hypothetical protein